MSSQPPDMPAPQFPDPGPPPRSKPLVGGLPWDAAAPAPRPEMEVKTRAARSEGGDEPAWSLSAHRLRRWWDNAVARSPAFTTSLAVHVALLVLLALIGIREQAAERLRLELSFGAANRDAGAEEEAHREEAAPAVEIDREAARIERPAPIPPVQRQEAPSAPPPVPDPAVPVAVAPAAEPASSTARPIAAALSGRGAESRQRLLGAGGGTAETESAVARALEWLVRQQRKDGLWSLQGPYLDGSKQENRLAATAMALLALQGAGATPEQGEHQGAVGRAWKTLLKLQAPDGTFDAGGILEQHQMYAHGQITIALCEAFGMTQDPRFEEPARRALEYAIAAQMPDGGWRYHPPRSGGENRGDMSVTGWYLMALKSGEMAGLVVPAETYERLSAFLDGVFVSPEKGYGYQIDPGRKFFDFRPALTAEALLCRQYLGWRRDDPRLVAGADLLLRRAPLDLEPGRKNVYAWYYQTQVFHHFGGPAWESWNRAMQGELLPAQVAGGREAGSWDPAHDQWASVVGGRLFMTSLCACMLEVYYRHLPLYRGQ